MATSSLSLLRVGSHPRSTTCRGRKLLVPRTFSCLQPFSAPEDQRMAYLEANSCSKRIEELKQGARKRFHNSSNFTSTMLLIDTFQHLGIDYHFEEEISVFLEQCQEIKGDEDDLFSTALRFRLLRQGGYNATSDVFHKFMDNKGKFKEDLSNDLKGLLSLHEASYFGTKHEEVLSQAMLFSKQHVQALMHHLEPNAPGDVNISLVYPRQRRMPRSEAKSYIEKFGHEHSRILDLKELATLDFNMVQSLHQQEMAELMGWWRNLGLATKLPFARDRPLECFLWMVGIFSEPRFSRCRIEVAKVVSILHVLDDIYDTYGSLDELVLFTDAIQRWEIDAMEKLPEYMKIMYLAIYNTTNAIANKVLMEHGWNISPHLKKTWIELCDAYLLEARWFNSGVVPGLEEYLENGITTSGTYMALVHAFFLMGNQSSEEATKLVTSCHELFSITGRILRLWDDLGTSRVEQQRGDVSSSIECYMKEKSYLENDARMHVRLLIDESWKDLNEESLIIFPLHHSIANASLNLARTSQSIYQNGDDDLAPSVDDNIKTILVKPIHHQYLL